MCRFCTLLRSICTAQATDDLVALARISMASCQDHSQIHLYGSQAVCCIFCVLTSLQRLALHDTYSCPLSVRNDQIIKCPPHNPSGYAVLQSHDPNNPPQYPLQRHLNLLDSTKPEYQVNLMDHHTCMHPQMAHTRGLSFLLRIAINAVFIRQSLGDWLCCRQVSLA